MVYVVLFLQLQTFHYITETFGNYVLMYNKIQTKQKYPEVNKHFLFDCILAVSMVSVTLLSLLLLLLLLHSHILKKNCAHMYTE